MYIYRFKTQQWVADDAILGFESCQRDDFKIQPTYYLYHADKSHSKAMTPVDAYFSPELNHEKIIRFSQDHKIKPLLSAQVTDEMRNHIKAAINLDWLTVSSPESVCDFIVEHTLFSEEVSKKYRVNVMALGDVGSTLAIGLKLLGGGSISEIGVWDVNPNQAKRWEIELNQISVNPEMYVKAIGMDALFDSDVFVFCASKFVPAVGEKVADVRMMQLEANAELVKYYVHKAADAKFKGLFCIVSDPVDMLCKVAFETSITMCDGAILPEQIRGYGLGVMYARAKYYAEDSFENGRVYGPHGKELVVANDITSYNHQKSLALTDLVVSANLKVRELGYKPYVAPAISSGAYSIVKTLEGAWHDSAIFLGGTYFGCRNRITLYGSEIEDHLLDRKLFDRIDNAYERLAIIWDAFNF